MPFLPSVPEDLTISGGALSGDQSPGNISLSEQPRDIAVDERSGPLANIDVKSYVLQSFPIAFQLLDERELIM